MPRKTFRTLKTTFKLFSYFCGASAIYAMVKEPQTSKTVLKDQLKKSAGK